MTKSVLRDISSVQSLYKKKVGVW